MSDNSKQVQFRNLKNYDEKIIIDLILKHYRETLPNFNEDENFRKDYCKALFSNNDLNVIIIESENDTIGFLLYLNQKHPIYNRNDIIIREIYIIEENRKNNIASDCVKYLIDRARKEKIDNIYVELLFNDYKAQNFWTRNKFFPFQQRFKHSSEKS